jgi:O-antigen ligase
MNVMTGTTPGGPQLAAARFSLAAIGLAWTLPFLQPFHQFPLTSFYSEWLALILGLVALVLLAGKRYWHDAPLPVMVLPLLGFILVLGVQYALGQVAYGGQPLAAGLYVAWAVLLVMLAGGLRRELSLDGIATVLAWFLVVGGVLAALFALLQHYQISDLPNTLIAPKRSALVYGNLAQANHFASYCTLALASLAYLYAGGRMPGVAVAAGAAPLIFVIGLTGSRSALLFLAFMLVLALLYAWRRGAGGKRLAVCVTLFVAGFALSQWLATQPWLASSGGTETVTQRLVGGEGSSGPINIAHRLQVAREAWEMFLQAPFLGVGWGQFPWQDFEYRAQHGRALSTWPFNHAHNIVLHLLAETGLAGTLLVAGAALAWLWGLRRARIDLAHWWVLALLGVIAVHSVLEHPLWFAYFLGIAAVAAGLVADGHVKLRLERAGPPLMLLLLAVGMLYAVSLVRNYRDFERLFETGGVRPETSEFASAVSRAHREPLLAPYAELAIATTMGLGTERLREKREINSRVMRFAPIAGVVYRQAILLALEGNQDGAAREFARAASVYPGELEATLKILREAAARHPVELTPLLELATAKSAQLRAARGKP